MISKNPKKTVQSMLILYVLIGLAALVVGIVAMILKQYLTVMAMGIVIVGQIWNYYKWKKKR